MSNGWIFALTLATALGSGLTAGAFFVFSVMVMPALANLPPVQGIAAMQSINVAAVGPAFLLVFVGTAALCVGTAISALVLWSEPGAGYLLAGSVLYILGTFLATMVFNVPRNNALAATEPAGEGSAEMWKRYVSGWTAWNHVRGAAALAATAAFVVALTR